MKLDNFIFFFSFFCIFSGSVSAQYISTDENYTTQQLVEDVLVSSSCANVSNIVVSNSWDFGSGTSIGYFSANGTDFPFAEGIIMSTGRAASAIGPNNSILSEGPTSWLGDNDLEQALGVNNSINATVLEFDFMPVSDKISFDYIFASEQYLTSPSANQCNYTDGFVFLLRAVNSNDQYQNLAVIPNTNIPVKVNTVRGPGTICPAANAQYFGGFNPSNHPTNFNGQTVVMTAQADVIPNQLYHIKLVVADQGNNLYDSAIFLGGGSFEIGKNLGEDRLIADNSPLCHGETVTLDATDPLGTDYKWFQDGTLVATTPTYQVSDAGIYTVEVTLNASSCISTGKVVIEYAPEIALNTPTTLLQCDDNNDGISTFNLTHADNIIKMGNTQLGIVKYYLNQTDAQNQQNAITNVTAFQNSVTSQLVARVTNQYGCAAFAVLDLQVTANTITIQPEYSVCTTGNSATIALSDANSTVLAGLPAGMQVVYYASTADALSQTNAVTSVTITNIPSQQLYYARIINGPNCYGIIPVKFNFRRINPIGFADENIALCENSAVDLTAPSGYASYTWNTTPVQNTTMISVETAGTYTVTVTDQNGCSIDKTWVVGAAATPVFTGVDINDFAGFGNSAVINFSGSGDYEFSLNGADFQSSPSFYGLVPGPYMVYLRSTGCNAVGPYPIFILDNPHFFTPNGDGVNDFWQIPFLNRQPQSVVHIFDRYGKLLSSFKGADQGWSGKFNGADLPASDYWFVLKLEDGRMINGHFSLLR